MEDARAAAPSTMKIEGATAMATAFSVEERRGAAAAASPEQLSQQLLLTSRPERTPNSLKLHENDTCHLPYSLCPA